ncbi:MAG: hypothetical protein ACE5FD_03140, partial [Anaerolineae bacterium]
MAESKLRILIDAAWKGDQATKQATAALKGLEKSSQDAANQQGRLGRIHDSITPGLATFAKGVGVASIALAGAGIAAKQAYDLIGEGAGLIRAEDQFNRLAISIGSTADVMLGKLKDATGGLAADAELVNSATQIMSLGLADNEEDVIRLANVVSQLGLDMQQVILTFANNSTARLDALGLSIEDVKSRAAALEAQGFNADKAFDLAVIEAGEEKIKLLGDAADSTVGDTQKLEAAFRNANDEFRKSLAGAVADEFAVLGSNAADASQVLENYAQITGKGTAETIKMLRFIPGVAVAFRRWEKEIEELNEEQARLAEETRRAELAIERSVEATIKADQNLQQYFETHEEGIPFVRGLTRENEELADKLAQSRDRSFEVSEAFAKAANLANDLAVSEKNASDAAAELEAELEAERLAAFRVEVEALKNELLGISPPDEALGRAFFELFQEGVRARGVLEEINAELDNLEDAHKSEVEIETEQALDAMGKLQEELDGLGASFDEPKSKAGDLATELDNIGGFFEANLESNIPEKEEKFVATHVDTPKEVRGIYMTACVAGTPSFRSKLVSLIED